jgi:predicted Zn-dependent protease
MISSFLAGKRVRLKQLLCLIVGIIVLGAGVHFLHAWQVRRNARDLYDQALQNDKEGHKNERMDLLQQYIQLNPADTDALEKLGFWRAEEAKNSRARESAMMTLEQVLLRAGKREAARRKVVELDLQLGHYKEARDHLVLLEKDHPEDPEILHWYALAETGAKNYDEADRLYKRATKIAPKRSKLSLDYARLLREFIKAPDFADLEIERLVDADPQSVDIRLAAAGYYFRAKDFEQSEEHLHVALTDLNASTAELLLLAAQVAQAQDHTDEARKLLERGCEQYPQDTRLSLELAHLEVLANNKKKALAALKPNLAKLPDDPVELWSLAELLLNADGTKEAGPLIARLAAKDQMAPFAECLQARVLMNEQQWGEAQRTLDGAIHRMRQTAPATKQAYLLLADCYRHLDDPDQRLQMCQRAVDCDPDWAPSRTALADALAAQGKLAEAIKQHRMLPRSNSEGQLSLARLLIFENQRLPESGRKWQEVERLLKELPASDQEKFETKAVKATLLVAQKRFDDAKDMMTKERDGDPKQIGPWLFLIELADIQEYRSEVLKLADEAEKDCGRHVEWDIVRARRWLKYGSAEGAAEELKKLEARVADYPSADGDRLLYAIAEAHAAKNQDDDAERIMLELGKREPMNLRVRLRLLERYYQLKNEVKLVGVLGEVRKIEAGEGPMTAYGEAAKWLLQAKSDKKETLTEARAWLKKGAALRPNWPRFAVLEAESDEIEKLKESALEKYKLALAHGEADLSIWRRTFDLLIELQRFGEAGALMRQLPADSIAFAGLESFASYLLTDKSANPGADPKLVLSKALDLARKAAGRSGNYRDWLWLGQLLAIADPNNPKEAKTAYRVAVAINDTAPDAWVLLIGLLARVDPAEAEKEITHAEPKLKDKAPLVLGPAYEALGKLEPAQKQFEAAVTANPSDLTGLRNLVGFFGRTGQLPKAEPWLQKALDPKINTTKETRAWARRSLALNLANRGGYQLFTQAQAILEQNAKEQGRSLEDQLTSALVLATRSDKRREAIKLLESLPGQGVTLPPEHQLVLAQLYDVDGQWEKARKLFLGLLNLSDRNAYVLGFYVRGLLHHHHADEALQWLDKLGEVEPNAWATIELRVMYLKEKGNIPAATNLLLAYAKRKDARLDWAASWLERLGQVTHAEKLYSDFASLSDHPENALQLALYLSRQKQAADALNICEKAWDKCSALSVSTTCMAIVRGGALSSDQKKRVADWYTAQQQKQPKYKVPLAMALADLKQFDGYTNEAINDYRAVLQQDPENAAALNNLAYLLAFRPDETASAFNMVQKAITKLGDLPDLLTTRAWIYVKTNRAGLAIDDLQRAIQQTPTPPRYVLLAKAQLMIKSPTAALDAWQRAVDAGLSDAMIHPLETPDYIQLKNDLGKK